MSDVQSLADLVGIRRGHFVFEAGAHGDAWLELDALFRRPDLLRPHATALARMLQKHDPAVVCGPMTGGALLAQLVGAELGCDVVWTEREVDAAGNVAYRLPGWALPVVADRRVVIVDDAISAGSAVRATCGALRVAGASVEGLAAAITSGGRIEEIERELALAVTRLVHIDARLWSPERCPLCASGEPLSLSPRF